MMIVKERAASSATNIEVSISVRLKKQKKISTNQKNKKQKY
jgi:hypothetical protein